MAIAFLCKLQNLWIPYSHLVIYVFSVQNLSERLAADAKCFIRELRPDAVVAPIGYTHCLYRAPIEEKSQPQAVQCQAKCKTVIAVVDASSLAGPEVKDSVARLIVDDGETTNHSDNRRLSKILQWQ
ncbi:hypothetical protein GQ457_12G008190 [Hibiscus cannabinus]